MARDLPDRIERFLDSLEYGPTVRPTTDAEITRRDIGYNTLELKTGAMERTFEEFERKLFAELVAYAGATVEHDDGDLSDTLLDALEELDMNGYGPSTVGDSDTLLFLHPAVREQLRDENAGSAALLVEGSDEFYGAEVHVSTPLPKDQAVVVDVDGLSKPPEAAFRQTYERTDLESVFAIEVIKPWLVRDESAIVAIEYIETDY